MSRPCNMTRNARTVSSPMRSPKRLVARQARGLIIGEVAREDLHAVLKLRIAAKERLKNFLGVVAVEATTTLLLGVLDLAPQHARDQHGHLMPLPLSHMGRERHQKRGAIDSLSYESERVGVEHIGGRMNRTLGQAMESAQLAVIVGRAWQPAMNLALLLTRRLS